jgi:flotillin
MDWIIGIGALLFLFVVSLSTAFACYKRCRSDQILVVYGKVGTGESARCIHGGAAFIWPLLQGYQFLDLTPMNVDANLTGALSQQNIRIDAPASFTVGISTTPDIMKNAAERLLGLSLTNIRDMAQEIIMGQMRQVIASMTIEEINSDREKLIDGVTKSIATELDKIGLRLINVNIRDVTDQGGYIEALGQEAAAKAVNEAKVKVAQARRDGEVGSALADKERTVQVAASQADAKEGENESAIRVAASEATRRTNEAASREKAETAEKIALANIEANSYAAKKRAEDARAEVERATRFANEVVPAEIERERIKVHAEAAAQKERVEAEGRADAIRFVQKAEADGIQAKLEGRAEGFKRLTEAAGSRPDLAINLLMVEQMPTLVSAQADAIKNIKIDKITVWDGASGQGDGSTQNFLRSLGGALPPLHAVAAQAGIKLPEFMGRVQSDKDMKNVPENHETSTTTQESA